MLSRDFFTNNRSNLARETKSGLILIAANSQLQKNSDEAFVFRQDSSFWYFTGINVPDAILIMNLDSGEELLVLPQRDAHRDQWEGPINKDELSKRSGLSNILDSKPGWQIAGSWIKKASTIFTLPPASAKFKNLYGIHPNPARKVLLQKISRISSGQKIESIRDQVKSLRLIKQKIEIEMIEQAIAMTEVGFKQVAARRNELNYEYQAKAVLEAAFFMAGSNGKAFDTVAAAGKNAAVLHYHEASQSISDSDILLIDAGAQAEYYAADLTRIYEPLTGFSEQQQAYLDAVSAVKEFAKKLIKPGVLHMEYESKVRERMGAELIRLGLIKTASSQEIRRYFPSLTTHHLGLDTHDIADYDEVFEENMVITIEPGIYDTQAGIGIRLEDDFVVTKTGVRLLSKNLPSVL